MCHFTGKSRILRLRAAFAVMPVFCGMFAADVPRAAGQEADPPGLRYRRDRQYIHADQTIFNSLTAMKLAVNETRSSLRLRWRLNELKRQWLEAENRAFHRLSEAVDKDLEFSLELRDDLRSPLQGVARFTNGSRLRQMRRDFIKLFRQVAHAPAVRSRLAQPVDRLGAENFGDHVYRGILLPDGALKPPPATLLDRAGNGRGREIFREFRHHWADCRADILEGTDPPSNRLRRTRRLLEEWDAVAGRFRGLRTPAAESYLENAGLLIEAVADSEERDGAREFLRESGHVFPGGTVSGLLRHVIEHDLVVKQGSTAGVKLAGLTETMIRTAEDEIALLDARIERLKRQSPAHTAATRQRLVPRGYNDDFSGTHAGLDSPAYSVPGRNRGPNDRTRPPQTPGLQAESPQVVAHRNAGTFDAGREDDGDMETARPSRRLHFLETGGSAPARSVEDRANSPAAGRQRSRAGSSDRRRFGIRAAAHRRQ